MATDDGTAGHLRNGWRMAKVGFWLGVFGLVSQAVGAVLFGGAAEWRDKLIAVPVWIVAFVVGGVLYSLFLPASVRARPDPAAGARARTGALAGAVTVGLPAAGAALLMFGAGEFVAQVAFVGVILVAIGALIGAACGFVASLEARYGGPAGGRARTGGIDGSPRLVDQP
jgi:hypothetical protein